MDFEKTNQIVLLSRLLVEKSKKITARLKDGMTYPEKEILRAEIQIISEAILSLTEGGTSSKLPHNTSALPSTPALNIHR